MTLGGGGGVPSEPGRPVPFHSQPFHLWLAQAGYKAEALWSRPRVARRKPHGEGRTVPCHFSHDAGSWLPLTPQSG